MVEVKKAPDNTSVVKFYDAKSILITGAAGFVGVVLLEILLRCCSGIRSIYILLREKKGVCPKDRKEELFKRSIFNKLRSEDPEVFSKVHVIAGDLSLPEMGICEEDLARIIEDVSVVFHCASSISFVKSLKYLILHNVGGVDNIIELCKKLKRCEVMVYTSTSYCNCNRRLKIEERVYRLPYPAERFLETIGNNDEDLLNQLVSDCKPEWPNSYTFSKCLAENIILEKASDVPTAIIRPSLISHIWKGALPGYIEENSSFAQLFIAIGRGFLKVVQVDPKLNLDFVPADVVANAHIIAGWAMATGRCASPFVVNCTSEGSYAYGMGDHTNIITGLCSKYPFPNIFRCSNHCWLLNHPIKIKILNVLEHYIPALGLDFVLLLKGKKPRVLRMYRFLNKIMKLTTHFVMNAWTYETGNFKSLEHIVSPEDKEVFYLDLETLNAKSYANALQSGAPFYDWKIDRKSKEERMKLAKRVYYFTLFIQASFIIIVCILLYTVISKVFNMFLVY